MNAPTGPAAGAADILARIEADPGLVDLRLGGWSAWSAVRWMVHGLCQAQDIPPSRGRRWSRAWRGVRAATDWLPPPRRRLLVAGHASALVVPSRDGWVDGFFDEACAGLPDACKALLVDNPAYAGRMRQAAWPAALDLSPLAVGAALATRLAPDPDVRRCAAGIADLLHGAAGIDPAASHPLLLAVLANFSGELRIWRWAFRRSGWRQVALVDTGSFAGLAAAAREAGAEVVELQHGSLDAEHCFYGCRIPARHRDRLVLPDRLLLWGPRWQRALAGIPIWAGRTEVVGSPLIDRYRAPAPEAAGAVPRVVVTLQWIGAEDLMAWVAAAARSIGPRLHWEVKPHPAQDAAALDRLRAIGLPAWVSLTDAAGGAPTLAALRGARCHLSISSSCHYEALALGLPTAVAGLPNHAPVLGLCDAGAASLVRDPGELAAWALSPPAPPAGFAADCFAPGATPAIRRALGDA